MGHYHSIVSRVTVRKDAPEELLTKLNQIYGITAVTDTQAEQLGDLRRLVLFSAAYLPEIAGKVEVGENGLTYSHTGSSKYHYRDIFSKFLNEYVQWFSVNKGAIVHRSVYEDVRDEALIVFTGKNFICVDGYEYEKYINEIGTQRAVSHLNPHDSWDSDSDSDSDRHCEHGHDTLPWNFSEIAKLNIANGKYKKDKYDMGTYCGIAIRLKIKNTIDPSVMKFFKDLVDRNPDVLYNCPAIAQHIAHSITSRSGSSYYPAWRWSYIDPEEGGSVLMESRASMKYIVGGIEALRTQFQEILPHLDLEKGDIILRETYEEASVENVIYYDGTNLLVTTGYQYAFFGQEALSNYVNPRHAIYSGLDPKEAAASEAANIPWNIDEVNNLNKIHREEALEEISGNSMGG